VRGCGQDQPWPRLGLPWPAPLEVHLRRSPVTSWPGFRMRVRIILRRTVHRGVRCRSLLMARSDHTSVRSLAKYARVSAEALQRHQAERDPARRR
jgi:hypothetical protein